MIAILRRAVPAAVLLGLLTACDTGTAAPAPSTVRSAEPTPAAAPAPNPSPSVDETAVIVDIAWARESESGKRSMCAGIAVFGTHWAAEQMKAGAGGSDAIDWERAAVLVQGKCDQM